MVWLLTSYRLGVSLLRLKHPWRHQTNDYKSNFANTASLLWHAYAVLPSPINWAGFYVREDKFPSSASTQSQPQKVLLLGPFQGKPACQLIHFGRGVCGTAAEKRETVLVRDVLEFPGHIACDAESRSEIVVPVLVGGEVCFNLVCLWLQWVVLMWVRLLGWLISTALRFLGSMRLIRSIWRFWLVFWLRDVTGEGYHVFVKSLQYVGISLWD